MDAADGENADRTMCGVLRHRSVPRVTGYRLGYRGGSAVGCAGASRFGIEARAARVVVKSSCLYARKSSWDLLHVLSRGAKSDLPRSGANRVGDTPRACCN